METIGKRIREYRKRQNLTQERLAEYIGVSEQAVSKWERSAAVPDIGLLVPLTKVLRCSADELLGIRKETPEEKEFTERVKRIVREEQKDLPPTFECREFRPDRGYDPYDPGLPFRRKMAQDNLPWIREVGKEENRELL